jgi:hypothetical protein
MFALRCSAALMVVGLAFAAAPASASETHLVCSVDHHGRPYDCRYAVEAAPCGGCGNRGLFTSTWTEPVRPAATCGSCGSYVPTCGTCESYVPVSADPDDTSSTGDSYRRRSHHHHDRSAARECGTINGKWHCH